MNRGAGGDEPVKDSAALQELSAGVVHGIYRAVKACQFHTDVTNAAVTSLTASASNAISEYCARAGTETVALSFLGDAIFVNRQILKASRDTHALAQELRDLLETCAVTELSLSRTVDRASISAFAKLLADVQRDPTLVARIRAGNIAGVVAGRAKFAASGAAREESPGQRAARTYATSVLTVQAVLADVRQGKYELPRRIKRVAQQVVARADEDARLLVALAATGGVSLDAATIAVGSAILAVAMTRQLTTDRAVLANAAMTALLYDAGRVALGGSADGVQRVLNEDELDRVPARTVVALTALGRMHAPARARTTLLYEVWSMRRAHRLGPIYKGRRPPTLLARIIGVARAFAELRGAGAGGGLSIDDALQMLQSRAADGTERALVKLLLGALGIYPAGTMVSLNTGELGVVMGTPAMPLDYVRPPVKILYDENANLLETPVDIDLAVAAPGQPMRFIWKSVDADEQQMKAMRAFVVAATAAKRRGALEPQEERAPRSTRSHVDAAPRAADVTQRPIPEPTLQSAVEAEPMVTRRPPAVVVDEPPASLRRPPVILHSPPPSSRGTAEHTPRSAHHVAPVAPVARDPSPPSRAELPRRRDPRNDSAPPSSMQDEIHRPVRVLRPPLVAPPVVAPSPAPEPQPNPDLVTVRPQPAAAGLSARLQQFEQIEDLQLEEIHDLEPMEQATDPNTRPTAPPPSSVDDADDPLSARDAMLAAFLGDGSDPPRAKDDEQAGRPTVKPDKA